MIGRSRSRARVTAAHALFLALAILAAEGCRKRQRPSEEYAQAHELFTKLYAAQLDDAYQDPQMTRVEELLRQVSDDSSDYADAQELATRIRQARRKAQEEDAARRTAASHATAVPYQRMLDDRRTETAQAPAAEDAGSSQPSPHMALSEFTSRFSGCFRQADEINLVGRGMVNSWELKDIANCRDRHPGFDRLLVLTDSREVVTSVAKSLVEYRLPDGGLLSQASGSPSAR
jgi:hypothetical protein